MTDTVFGPTLAQMREPDTIPADLRARAEAARQRDPLSPINLFNIHWRGPDGQIDHLVVPPALTGVDAPIVVLSGRHFPTGSHKVGPAYTIARERQLAGRVTPGQDTLVFPSTGNFGIGGAWVGPRMGFDSLVVLPEEMSAERFEKIRHYGAEVIATPGCESNVKEIYDEVARLRRRPHHKILNQFETFGNYRFHYHVTGQALLDLLGELAEAGVGDGRPAALVSAMGSAGTIAAGDHLKQHTPTCQIVGLEPVQCPTLYNVGYGAHRIEGIGDKHVTWIHHVTNMDLLFCIDDRDTLRGLQLLQEGTDHLVDALGLEREAAEALVGVFGPSGVCNLIGAIKAARYLELGPERAVVTFATDGFDRYPSVLRRLDADEGPMTAAEAHQRLSIFLDARLDHVLEGTRQVRRRWHNQKYFTWVEQQGKTVEALEAQLDEAYWVDRQRAPEGV